MIPPFYFVPVPVPAQPSYWDAISTWLSSIGSFGSLVLATYLLLRETRERRRQNAEADAGRLRNIAAWVREASNWFIVVRNGTDEPIYNCIAYARPIGEKYCSDIWNRLPPGELEVSIGDIGPGETREAEVEGEHLKTFWWPPNLTASPCPPWVELEFTDYRGAHWRRDLKGSLTPINSLTFFARDRSVGSGIHYYGPPKKG